MKRIIALVLIAMLSFCAAAEDSELFEEFIKNMGEIVWEEDKPECVQTAVLGEVTVSICMDGERIAAITIEQPLGADREELERVLRAAAEWDSVALAGILDAAESAQWQLENLSVRYIAGETREGFYLCTSEEGLLWQPVHGGDQLHASSECSGMDVPRLITAGAGELLGYDGCDNCLKTDGE